MVSKDASEELSVDIACELDEAAQRMRFPVWDNGYVSPAGGRLSVFGDGADWAIVIEAIGCFHKASRPFRQFQNAVYRFGSCFKVRTKGPASEEIHVVSEARGHKLWNRDGVLQRDVSQVCLRGTPVWMTLERDAYDLHDIPLVNEQAVSEPDLLRLLVRCYRSDFLATQSELRQGLPKRLPLLLQLEEWIHPDVARGELPSQTETFAHAAVVAAVADPTQYRVRAEPNTDWRNWPNGGTL